MNDDPQIQVFDAVGTAFDWYGRTWALVIPIAYVVTAVFALGQVYAVENFSKDDLLQAMVLGGVGLVVYFGANMVMQGAFILAAARAHDDQSMPTIGGIISQALPLLGVLVLAALLETAIVIGGLILLVVPGIIFAIYLSFVGIAVVLERRGVKDALSRSWDLVRGNWWRMFGLVLLMAIIGGIATLVLTFVLRIFTPDDGYLAALVGAIPGALTAPLTIHAIAAAYFQLVDAERLRGEGSLPA